MSVHLNRGSMNTILLVDDDPDLVEVYTELLEQLGFSVTSAVDGQAALTLAPELQPDLIITDVSMPRMSGLELTRQLRLHPRLSGVPILIHSSERELRVPHGEVFLPKTGKLPEFVKLVHRLLEKATSDPVLASVA
jgi:CheY-like chemotaxis protein